MIEVDATKKCSSCRRAFEACLGKCHVRVCEGEGSAALVEDVTSARIGEGGEMICMGGRALCDCAVGREDAEGAAGGHEMLFIKRG